jgi:ketosteroid isomerase-like protein
LRRPLGRRCGSEVNAEARVSSSTELAELVEAIRAASEARVTRIHERAVDTLVDEFYVEGARLMAPGRPPVRGAAELRTYWQNEFDEGLVTLNLNPTEIDGSGDLAYEIGTYDLMVRRAARGPFQDHGKYVVVYKRQPDDSWKAAADIFNSDLRQY